MKRENDIEGKDSDENEKAANKRAKSEYALNLDNLGAGYSQSDKKVAKAIEFYEDKLLPFIQENQSIFKSSNFLSIKGYATDISSTTRASET